MECTHVIVPGPGPTSSGILCTGHLCSETKKSNWNHSKEWRAFPTMQIKTKQADFFKPVKQKLRREMNNAYNGREKN